MLVLLYRPSTARLDSGNPPDLDGVRRVIPGAAFVEEVADAAGWWTVRSESGEVLGRVARTLPAASNIRGYRGATEAILAIDSQNRISAVDVLHSLDTSEHVAAVRQNASFLNQFVGWTITAASHREASPIDAVSGATLTSLAMAGGILARLGETPESLVFPEPLTEEERRRFIRTGPLVDDIAGYQGPTELLFAVSDQGVVEQIKIRSSFDNRQYVDYVADDRYFWKLFQGKSLEQLAAFDLVEQQVEGVSGATMTSQAVAETIVAAAEKLVAAKRASESVETAGGMWNLTTWTFSTAEVATVVWVLLAGIFSILGLQRRKRVRTLWLASTVIVLGLWAGNLLSLSLLVGWASSGAAWTIAPGLAILVAIALLSPPLGKQNVYCSHLCPHGAIQQLIRPQGVIDQSVLGRNRRRWQIRIRPSWQRLLKWIPGTTLVAAYLLVLFRPATDLASWEPFHAYLYPIASVATVALFFSSLAISTLVPMAYCRFGCPTGSLLDYLRRTAVSRRITRVDGVLALLLGIALMQRTFL